jgi:hypothetical protein
MQIDGEPVEPPHPLPWYPGGLAWQMNFSRTQLRKLPVLEALHEFIKRENEASLAWPWPGKPCCKHSGNITARVDVLWAAVAQPCPSLLTAHACPLVRPSGPQTGSITRQEAVSMVPPLFLDVRVSRGGAPGWGCAWL